MRRGYSSRQSFAQLADPPRDPAPGAVAQALPAAQMVELNRMGEHGIDRACQLLRAGSPARAFAALVVATEAEARIGGLGDIRLPAADGMRRLIAVRRERQARKQVAA